MRLVASSHIGPYEGSRLHQHREWEIGVYTAGSGTAGIGELRLALAPRTLVCYPPDIPHYDLAERPLSGFFFSVDELPGFAALPAAVDDGDDDAAARIAALIVEARRPESARPDSELELALLESLVQLLRRLHGRRRRLHPLVERLERLLRDGVGDSGFSVAAALATLPLSKDHLRRLFIRDLGRPPARYLAELRIARARDLLRMGQSVKQVSREAGFDDPYYFSRAFKAATGKPPSAWAR